MLQTRFVFFSENFVTRRYRMMNTVSSRFQAVPARSSGSFRELTNFTNQIFGKMCKNIVPASWLACDWPLGPFCVKRKIGWLIFGGHPSYHRVFSFLAQLQVVPPQHFVCREVYQGILIPVATGLLVPGHLGNAVGRPVPCLGSSGLGHRNEELLATCL